MARMNLKLKKPVTDFDFDVDENSLESNGWSRIVRCGECKYWSGPVDEIDGKLYGQCERPISAIMPTSLVNSKWYCADGERKVQE